ncbi:MAG: transketolase [Acetobacterales bacterium]
MISSRATPAADHREMANAIRFLAADAVERAKSGHPGMPMGMADVATVLFTRFLKYDAAAPRWPDRDRFVLSAGHGSMLLYSLLYLTGYEGMTIDELRNFRQFGSKTPGHPEVEAHPGIETTTGPLGQGLGNAVGLALAERILAARFGDDLVDHYTYAIVGDGCLMEGISHEVASLAGHLKLARLIVLFDDNRISIDGPTSLAESDDTQARFRAYGWDVSAVDGHDPEAVAAAIATARDTDRPSLIACRTTIGFGAPKLAGTAATHGSPLGAEEIAGARAALGWPYPAFEVPEHVLGAWRAAGAAGTESREAWEKRRLGHSRCAEFDGAMAGEIPEAAHAALRTVTGSFVAEKPKLASRQSSNKVLDALVPAFPGLLGGSADLTGSNGTYVKGTKAVAPGDYAGQYVHYGVREHGMAAAMNGIALHGGLIPYSGTFLAFADYGRPAIRLAALMHQRVIHVMTHDSIGLGEDGPTHQPVEHLASLRVIPNVCVFRPADSVETAECWALALERSGGPSVLALTRQGLPALREEAGENLSARGGYVIREASGPRKATLLATGSEVSLACEARDVLEGEGIPTAVVSMPCWELFDAQEADYRAAVLGEGVRVAVEAAVSFGWDRYIGPAGAFVGMAGFGASAPYSELYAHFEITPAAVVTAVKQRL